MVFIMLYLPIIIIGWVYMTPAFIMHEKHNVNYPLLENIVTKL